MQEKNCSIVDTLKIRKAIDDGIPLLITTYTLPYDMQIYMCEVLSCFLKELNHEYMTEYLTYCLNELTINAKKANTKRIYFAEQQLDINNEADYNKGMKTFKRDTMNNINKYLTLQKNAGLFVKVLLQVRNGKIKIEIRNNSELTVFEYKRIHDKLTRAQQLDSIENAFSQVIDETEGAGLGLVIMILMLRKIGLTDDNFSYISENGETITRIVLPLNPESQEQIDVISKNFINAIEELPYIPENIQNINRLLNDPNSKLSEIAQQISNDVTLTADLLKLVNSAAFSLREPCHSITNAVQMVGIRGIKNLLFSLGSMENLGSKSLNTKDIRAHSNKVAFYAYNLARNFYPKEREVIEDSFVCGLLHDIGKLLFENINPEIVSKLKKISEAQNISSQTLEKLYAGKNHAEIGASVAEKWNFPEVIVNSIRFHHNPSQVEDKYKNITNVVYLANMIAQYEIGIIEYYQFDKDVLDELNILSEEHLSQISNQLVEAYAKQSQN